ncbi:MAG TPA: DCC1-like thiol-disulfide oxidoreductase family protein [Candidatus Limnocylindrales bacterium]|nr:DCC1-like thiol-disulfide oxidoreductase family protein [Candidatus Limnocylindrales bacterium]
MDRSGTLLYDADCGLCIATATRLGQLVPVEKLGLVPLQEVASEPLVAAAVEGRDLAEQLHFVRSDGVVLTGARAALAAGRLIPVMGWYATLLDQPIGHALLEPLYRQVAAHRRRIGGLLGLPQECPLPHRPREG